MDTDRNLLFGVLALQADLITQNQFVEACSSWASRKETPLGDLLVERHWLTPNDRADVVKLLERKLKKHGGDVKASLAEVVSEPVRQSLAGTGDPDVLASVAGSTPQPGHVQISTGEFLPETRDRYTLSRLHATGGLGRVWLARDASLGRDVALKEIRPERIDNPNLWARFLKEAQITGQLEHPGIVPVYELSHRSTDKQPFYTMRFIRGRTLSEACRAYHQRRRLGESGPLEVRNLLTALVGVCNAVAYAHSRGVVHRDLKPQNVVLGDYGEVMVLDWGLARLMDQPETGSDDLPVIVEPATADGATVQGQVIGTPAYMAPEQAEGRLDRLDQRTDVYGLGAILYEILAGQPPFRGENTHDVLAKVRTLDPEPPRVIWPGVPRALEAICRKALAKRQDDRYASASELATEVQHWLADEPVAAYREPLPIRAGRWARRHQAWAAGSMTALVLGLAGLGVAYGLHLHYQEVTRQQELHRIDVQRQQADDRAEVALAYAREGSLDRAISNLSVAVGICQEEDALATMRDRLQAQLGQLEQYRRFHQVAIKALTQGSHGFGARKRPDPIAEECERALTVYGAMESDEWTATLDKSPLTPAQASEVKSLTAELLTVLAMRLALYDTKDEAGRIGVLRALALLDRVEALQGPTFVLWGLRWRCHRRLGDKAAGDRAGDLMTKTPPRTATEFYLAGSFTISVLKDHRAAVNAYNRALALEPNHHGAHLGKFFAFEALEDLPGQIAALDVCLALRPEQTELYLFRGVALFKAQQYVLAQSDFSTLVKRDTKHNQGHYWRGRTNFILGSSKNKLWAEADQDFTRALALDPNYPSPYYWRALARAKLGRHREAIEDIEHSLRNDPHGETELWNAARTFALCVPAVLADDREPNRQERADEYGTRAVALLRDYVEKGFVKTSNDRLSLQKSQDLDPLRPRADFQKLLAELEKKEKEKK